MSALVERLQADLGREVGVSDWQVVTQDMIDRFADVTGDHQFIHVDPARAAATPFGGTIAHGFLTLSLLSRLRQAAVPRLDGQAIGVNYGFDKVRFPCPVRAGARVRGRFVLAAVTPRGPGELLMQHRVTVEIEGQAKPAVVADWLTMVAMRPDAA